MPSYARIAAALCERYGAVDALLTDSGTSALIVLLRAQLPRGGAVAYPAYGCVDLIAAAERAGVRIRLYDLDPATLSPDLDSVHRAIRRGVDGIVVAHMYGYPADVRGVQLLAASSGIPVIEDAAQGSGGSLDGTLLGGIGETSILSFGRGKGTTCGSGGAVLVRTQSLAEQTARIRREFVQAQPGGREIIVLTAQWLLGHPSLYRIPASIPLLKLGETVYRAPHEPRSMPATAAAILPGALQMEAREVSSRRTCANILLPRIAQSAGLTAVRAVTGGAPGFLRLAFLDSAGGRVPDASLGAVRGYPITLDQHPRMHALLQSRERAGTGAKLLRDRLFTLPTHSRVARSDVERMAIWIARV